MPLSTSVTGGKVLGGHSVWLYSGPLQQGSLEFDLFSGTETSPFMTVVRRSTKGVTNPRGWGVGSKTLILVNDRNNSKTPVLLKTSTEDSSKQTAELMQHVIDPFFIFDENTQHCYVMFWVNGWSSPGTPEARPWSAFDDPVTFTPVSQYPTDTGQPIPQYRSMEVREVPRYEATERVGPFDPDRFWVAPMPGHHSYRLSQDFDPLVQDTSGLPPIPPSVSVGLDLADEFLEAFARYRVPLTQETQTLRTAFTKQSNGKSLTEIEKATVDDYTKEPYRWIGLNRTTRCLMICRGTFHSLVRTDRIDNPTTKGASLPTPQKERKSSKQYLILESPKVVGVFPATTNRILAARHKWTAFFPSGDIFITAPANYRYPASASLDLMRSVPQTDQLLTDPAFGLFATQRQGILPESSISSSGLTAPEAGVILPVGYPTSLVSLLLNLGLWSTP